MDENSQQAIRYWTLAQPVISGYVTSVVRDFRDRDDVLQSVAVAVFESFSSYDSSRSFIGWTMGIARNQIGTYLRERRRNRLVFDGETVELLAKAFEQIETDETRSLDYLHQCLDGLEGRARQLCELRYENDLKPAGHETSIPLTNMHEGLEQLRQAYHVQFSSLGPEEYDEQEGETVRMLVAIKKPRERGPQRVEITYESKSGRILHVRFVQMPYGPDRLDLRLSSVNENALPTDFFEHTSHHTPDRKVETEN